MCCNYGLKNIATFLKSLRTGYCVSRVFGCVCLGACVCVCVRACVRATAHTHAIEIFLCYIWRQRPNIIHIFIGQLKRVLTL